MMAYQSVPVQMAAPMQLPSHQYQYPAQAAQPQYQYPAQTVQYQYPGQTAQPCMPPPYQQWGSQSAVQGTAVKQESELTDYVFNEIHVSRGSLGEDMGVTMEGTHVESVIPGAVGSMHGLVKGMTITTVDSAPATQDAIANVFQNKTAFTLNVSCSCLVRLRGEVDSWDSAKNSGWISPLVPIYVGASTWGSQAVFFGNVRCASTAIKGKSSLAIKQKVEFSLKLLNSKLHAVDVTGPHNAEVLECPPAAGKEVITRELSLDGEDKQMCAKFMKNACPYNGESCPEGLHLQECVQVVEKKKVPKRKGKKPCLKITFNDEWDSVTFMTQGLGMDLEYSKNNGNLKQVTKVRYDTINKSLELTCLGECEEIITQDLPELSLSQVLSDMADLCKNCNVCCKFPTLVPDTRHKGLESLFTEVGEKKLQILKDKWEEISGGLDCSWGVINAWAVNGVHHKAAFHNAEQALMKKYKKPPSIKNTYYGLPESCVVEAASNGLANTLQNITPASAIQHCNGGNYMFLCKTVLGVDGGDFKWVPSSEGYEVTGARAMPHYLLQFGYSESKLTQDLKAFSREVEESLVSLAKLGESQRGGSTACKGRTDAAIMATSTKHLWVGWLAPEFEQSDDSISTDVKEFLKGHNVSFVKIERNAARIGAYVELETSVSQCQLSELNTRLYKGSHTISVDDSQPENPWTAGKGCPRLAGPAKYCRGWNIKGHADWTESCSFKHRPSDNILNQAHLRYTAPIDSNSSVFDELAHEVRTRQLGHVLGVEKVHNDTLHGIYQTRKKFLENKHGAIIEQDLWFGTNPTNLSCICRDGVQPPSDTAASPLCRMSGGLDTTRCDARCKMCTEPHPYSGCHKYGLGIRLSEHMSVAHKDVTPNPQTGVHSLVRCRVNLGRPYVINTKLVKPDAMHNVVRPVNPEGRVEEGGGEWQTARGYDSYIVKTAECDEYVVFHPFQVLPMYIVHYMLGQAPSVPQQVMLPPQADARFPPPAQVAYPQYQPPQQLQPQPQPEQVYFPRYYTQ
eukprot:TRINITY_DN30228_c0_g1_i1.p1 TRINITY_DN30228_c0_g1~~TRINITY_DN30228_c0_g1_i1.p1  ORF type:complete len:1021 (+),score=268.66 TRINITY_DN30228_c0_g1_i1:88-3150(+)